MRTNNRFELTGRLVADPEVKTSKKGDEFATARVAVNYSDENTTFLELVAFEKTASILLQLNKGTLINASGRLDANGYLSKDGEPKAGISMVVNEIVAFADIRLAKDEEQTSEEN